MGSSTTMVLRLTSSAALPSNLAVAINGDEIDVDECDGNTSPFDHSIQVNDSGQEAIVRFQLDADSEDREIYFTDFDSGPNSDLVDIAIFSRSTCSDALSTFKALEEQELNWEPVYANGESCGVTSYTSDSTFSVD